MSALLVGATAVSAQDGTSGSDGFDLCDVGELETYWPCVPDVLPADLNCPDIGFSVEIRGSDPYGFDRNDDGTGCEGNGPLPDPPVTCNNRLATIIGTEGRDLIAGTAGADVIVGLGGDDVIRGGDGNDAICGGNGRDRLFGGRGNDHLFGGKRNDIVKGDQGADALFGEQGNDRLFGGGGRDTMAGGSGIRDRLDGKGGIDTCTDPQITTSLFLNCES